MNDLYWRHVSEDLPYDQEAVLIFLPREGYAPVWIGYCESEDGMPESWWTVDHEPVEVTYWMPLPPAPGEE